MYRSKPSPKIKSAIEVPTKDKALRQKKDETIFRTPKF